jgi:hypothetical protein
VLQLGILPSIAPPHLDVSFLARKKTSKNFSERAWKDKGLGGYYDFKTFLFNWAKKSHKFFLKLDALVFAIPYPPRNWKLLFVEPDLRE